MARITIKVIIVNPLILKIKIKKQIFHVVNNSLGKIPTCFFNQIKQNKMF